MCHVPSYVTIFSSYFYLLVPIQTALLCDIQQNSVWSTFCLFTNALVSLFPLKMWPANVFLCCAVCLQNCMWVVVTSTFPLSIPSSLNQFRWSEIAAYLPVRFLVQWPCSVVCSHVLVAVVARLYKWPYLCVLRNWYVVVCCRVISLSSCMMIDESVASRLCLFSVICIISARDAVSIYELAKACSAWTNDRICCCNGQHQCSGTSCIVTEILYAVL